jgi:hypothetical protein
MNYETYSRERHLPRLSMDSPLMKAYSGISSLKIHPTLEDCGKQE